MSNKIDGDALWELLGRDSTAGNALYNLYNTDNLHGRSSGLQFSQRNRKKIEQQLSSAKAATGSASAGASASKNKEQPKKPKVHVPRFRPQSPTSPTGGVAKLAQIPHRRQAQQIMAAIEADKREAWGSLPHPSGPLLDEQEKQRCALLMQYKGKLPPDPEGQQLPAAGRRQHQQLPEGSAAGSSLLSRQRLMLQQRFEEVAAEVAEREEFVSSMQQLGRLTSETASMMKGQAAAKVREMGQLDQQIRQLDIQIRQDAAAIK